MWKLETSSARAWTFHRTQFASSINIFRNFEVEVIFQYFNTLSLWRGCLTYDNWASALAKNLKFGWKPLKNDFLATCWIMSCDVLKEFLNSEGTAVGSLRHLKKLDFNKCFVFLFRTLGNINQTDFDSNMLRTDFFCLCKWTLLFNACYKLGVGVRLWEMWTLTSPGGSNERSCHVVLWKVWHLKARKLPSLFLFNHSFLKRVSRKSPNFM